MQTREKKDALLERLAESFTNNNKVFLLVNVMIFISIPLLVPLKYRYGVDTDYAQIILFVLMFLFSLWQSKNIYFRLPQNSFDTKNKKLSFLIYYIYIPLLAPIATLLIVGLVGRVFVKNSNPQGLTSISSNEIYISLVSDILAGAEEIWRYSSILVIYLLLNYGVGKLNKGKNIQIALLMISFIVSSFLFGWMHTFAYSDGWINLDITIMIGLMGLCFATIMFFTKRIWSVILTHIVFDVYTTFNSYDRTIVNSILMVACLSASIILLFTKRKGKTEIET